MPPTLALCLCAVFVVWLCRTDDRPNVSAAIWLPVTWAFIIASRPVSLWFGNAVKGEAGGMQDQFIDIALFVFLITAALLVIVRRSPDWPSIFRTNKWVFLYFLYVGISVLWSDDPLTSGKRWFKNFGNVIMVLTILSEMDPARAVRAFLARWVYLVVPLSIVVYKYFPAVSRNYDMWTHKPVFVGIGLDKNTSGMAMFVSGLTLIWIMVEPRPAGRPSWARVLAHATLLLITVWMLSRYRSATAILCFGLGALILVGTRLPACQAHVRRLTSYGIGAIAAILLLAVTGLGDVVLKEGVSLLGRDATLHGRGEIWTRVLQEDEDVNPLIGAGFYSFWSAERNRRLSKGFYYTLGEAHNGYIESYLNHGLIGLALLLAMLAAASQAAKNAVLEGAAFGHLRIALLITILIYNITESAFDRLVPVWLALLLVAMDYPPSSSRIPRASLQVISWGGYRRGAPRDAEVLTAR